jgi:hypothetical protein
MILLKHVRYRPEIPRQKPPWSINVHLKQKWRAGGKNRSFPGVVTRGDGWAQEKGKWGW